MASSRLRIQFMLTVTFSSALLLPVRSGDGAMLVVGDEHGWIYQPTKTVNSTSQFNYQAWADAGSYFVNDSLYFGNTSKVDPTKALKLVSREDAEICNTFAGWWLPPETSPETRLFTIFNLSNPGNYGFISPVHNYCTSGMKFTITVSALHRENSLPAKLDSPCPKGLKDVHVGYIVAGFVGGLATGTVLAVALIAIAIVRREPTFCAALKKFCAWKVGPDLPNSDLHSSENMDVDAAADIKSSPRQGPQRYSYKELIEATNSFDSSLVIGQGGFGTVYKGFLRDSHEATVAVKRLCPHALQGAREFMAEINIISQLRHRNLVPLLGWCDENEELILVYQYMPNGDLDDLIFGGGWRGTGNPELSPLAWKYRYNSFCGVATALVYLHEEWEQRVVHRDVKTSNVMLDSQLNARLGDFGLARLYAHSQAPTTTLVAGTIGYLPPEFNLTGRATAKTDVYAFGVVVLEVSCARRPLTSNCILLDWVWELHKEGKLLDAIDPKLDVRSTSNEEEMKRALQVGLLCCHPDPVARPSMRDALNILTCKTPLPRMPRSKPVAFFASPSSVSPSTVSPNVSRAFSRERTMLSPRASDASPPTTVSPNFSRVFSRERTLLSPRASPTDASPPTTVSPNVTRVFSRERTILSPRCPSSANASPITATISPNVSLVFSRERTILSPRCAPPITVERKFKSGPLPIVAVLEINDPNKNRKHQSPHSICTMTIIT